MQIRRRPPSSELSISTCTYKIPVPDAQPQHILEEIVWHKETEVDRLRDRLPLRELQSKVAQQQHPVRDFLAALRAKNPAVIAEVKKASPSRGVIRADFDPTAIARDYATGGAACISVLTDEKFFQGNFNNLALVRAAVDIPLLCKEFIINAYQIYYARHHGADAVLLIAAILSNQDLRYFIKICKSLGMVALIEVHNSEELERVMALPGVELIGINNRDLTNFSVSLATTQALLASKRQQLEAQGILVVSESGIYTRADVNSVTAAGAQAVLVGESLVKQPDVYQAIVNLLNPN